MLAIALLAAGIIGAIYAYKKVTAAPQTSAQVAQAQARQVVTGIAGGSVGSVILTSAGSPTTPGVSNTQGAMRPVGRFAVAT